MAFVRADVVAIETRVLSPIRNVAAGMAGAVAAWFLFWGTLLVLGVEEMG